MMRDPKEIAMNTRFFRPVLLLALLTSLTACISTFTPLDPDFRPKGKTMAVVAGVDDGDNIALAYAMTEALRKNSRFQVVPQKQVAQSLGYPISIRGPFKTAYFEIETDYTKSDMKRIRGIQQALGVDYLYVIWTPSETVYNQKIHSLHAVGQMFEGSGSKEVGNGRFDVTAGRTDCCLVPAPGDAEKQDAKKTTSEYVAKQIAEKMRMAK
jgi:hypothetical protein